MALHKKFHNFWSCSSSLTNFLKTQGVFCKNVFSILFPSSSFLLAMDKLHRRERCHLLPVPLLEVIRPQCRPHLPLPPHSLPLSLSLSLCLSPRARNPSSGRRVAPPLWATPSSPVKSRSSASTPRSSSPTRACRDVSNRENRAADFRPLPPVPRMSSSPSGLSAPPRPRHQAPGELQVLAHRSSLFLPP